MQRIALYGTMLALGIVWGCNTAVNPQPTPTPEPKPTPTPTPEPTPAPYVPSERVMRSCDGYLELEQIEAAHTALTADMDTGVSKADAVADAFEFCNNSDGDHTICTTCTLAVIDDVYVTE